MRPSAKMRAGDWVEVKGKNEILATLDRNGRLEGLPFMPEMFEHCGRRFRIAKRAHKTCDPPNGIKGRRMASTVHLDLRCDGRAHGGCQAGCLLFWKEAWLLEVPDGGPPAPVGPDRGSGSRPEGMGCSERDVWDSTRVRDDEQPGSEPRYVCQSTNLAEATQPLRWWDVRQYIEDYRSGNARAGQLLGALLFSVYSTLVDAGIGLGAALRWLYDRLQALRGGSRYPSRPGRIPVGMPTPAAKLDLRPGERVRVKRYPEILETLNTTWHNRGMYFDAEAVVFCGETHEVLRRVDRIIDERTGRMLHFKSDAIILKDVVCQARYARCRKLCPRAIYPYWREIWLERVSEPSAPASGDGRA